MGEIARALIGKKVLISSIFGLLFTYLFFRQLGSWPEADPCQLIPLHPVVLPNPPPPRWKKRVSSCNSNCTRSLPSQGLTEKGRSDPSLSLRSGRGSGASDSHVEKAGLLPPFLRMPEFSGELSLGTNGDSRLNKNSTTWK